MLSYKYGLRPLLYALCGGDAERVHNLLMHILRQPGVPAVLRLVLPVTADARLQQVVLGLNVPAPFGLAAGLDKDAVALKALEAFGFGFLTIGAVVPDGQPGNDKPRMFTLWRDGAIINRMGFNSAGSVAVMVRLSEVKTRVPTIANLGVQKKHALDPERALSDFKYGIQTLGAYADIVEINISSPNTDGLRELVRSLPSMVPALQAVAKDVSRCSGRRLRVAYKLSGDMDEALEEQVHEHIVCGGGDMLVRINTTTDRSGLRSKHRHEKGGLSGPPIRERALRSVKRSRQLVPAHMPIIGIGGITNAADAIEMLKCGANLLAGLTGFVAHDPLIATHIHRGILQHMEREGMTSIAEFQNCWP